MVTSRKTTGAPRPVKNGTERKMPGESRILSGSCESPATRDPMKKSLSN